MDHPLRPSAAPFEGATPADRQSRIRGVHLAASKERIEKAKADWKEGRFAKVPGDSEFIPLPDR